MNYEKPEKSYMFVSKEKYFKSQKDMLNFVESMINMLGKQKHDILQQMHEAKLWYEKDEKN
jgi:hypothetical protein